MRVAIGGFFHESNTFVRRPMTLADYEATRLYTGEEMLAPLRGTDTEIGGFLAAAGEAGFEVVAEKAHRPAPEKLAGLELDERFRGYSLADVSVESLALVARPSPDAA